MQTFDIERARLNDEDLFQPFRVQSTQRLTAALGRGTVKDDTAVLVMAHGGTALALVTRQMTYHHVAQGELAGEPWLVSF